MTKRVSGIRLIALACLWLTALDASGAGRGVVVVRDAAGQAVELYNGSHALLIGVSDYTDGWSDLRSVPGELDRIQQALEAQDFSVTRVRDPDSAGLERAFKTFIAAHGLDRGNRLLVFFSGHGYTDEDGLGYLVPADAPDPVRDVQGLLAKAFSMNQILALARDLKAKHALMLFDSCFSGTVFKAKELPEHPPYITDSTAKKVRQFITAGDAGEEVPARSTFALVFTEAFEPAVADPVRGQEFARGDLNRDGYVTGEELGIHLRTEVSQYVAQTPQYGKIRDFWLSRGDFVFVTPPRPMASIQLQESPQKQIAKKPDANQKKESMEVPPGGGAEDVKPESTTADPGQRYPGGLMVMSLIVGLVVIFAIGRYWFQSRNLLKKGTRTPQPQLDKNRIRQNITLINQRLLGLYQDPMLNSESKMDELFSFCIDEMDSIRSQTESQGFGRLLDKDATLAARLNDALGKVIELTDKLRRESGKPVAKKDIETLRSTIIAIGEIVTSV